MKHLKTFERLNLKKADPNKLYMAKIYMTPMTQRITNKIVMGYINSNQELSNKSCKLVGKIEFNDNHNAYILSGYIIDNEIVPEDNGKFHQKGPLTTQNLKSATKEEIKKYNFYNQINKFNI